MSFIAVACEQCSEAVIDPVRQTVLACPHAVLIKSGCLMGPMFCRSHNDGGVLMVQPCTTDQRPSGEATLLGPLKSGPDIATICDWLRQGLPHSIRLPERLFGVRKRITRSSLN